MDSSTPNGSHQQDRQNGTDYNNLFNGMHDYAFGSQDEFMYDTPDLSTLFPQNPDQPPVFTHQTIAPDANWSQNALQQSNEPVINNYGTLQNTFQSQPYPQSHFDVRPFVQQTYDPRTMARPSHSPIPYTNYQFQTPMTYSGRDPSLAPSQSFQQQQSLAQQRSPSIHPTAFPAPQHQNPYFGFSGRQGVPTTHQVSLLSI